MTTEPTEKHRAEARELMCGPRTEGKSPSWLLKGNLTDLHERIASALSARDAETNRAIDTLVKAHNDAMNGRDAEVREVLEGLVTIVLEDGDKSERHWCPIGEDADNECGPSCLAARELYNKLNSTSDT